MKKVPVERLITGVPMFLLATWLYSIAAVPALDWPSWTLILGPLFGIMVASDANDRLWGDTEYEQQAYRFNRITRRAEERRSYGID